jgi:hypothetical protein
MPLIQRHLALHFARRVVSLGRYPGQYFIADRLGRVLAPSGKPVIGRIGSYHVELYLHQRNRYAPMTGSCCGSTQRKPS